MSLECRELESFLPAYVDGEFDGSERAEVESHLAGCAECQHAVRIQAAMKDAVRRAAPAIAPIELRHSVQLALRDEELPGSRWDSVLRNPRSVGPCQFGAARDRHVGKGAVAARCHLTARLRVDAA